MMSSYKHHPSSGFFSAFLFAIIYWEIMLFGDFQTPFKIYRNKYLGSKYSILSIMLWFAKMALFNYFFIKSISKSKMDIFILSNLEILKTFWKKCATCILWQQLIFIVFWMYKQTIKGLQHWSSSIKRFLCVLLLELAYTNTNLIYYFIYNLKNIHK